MQTLSTTLRCVDIRHPHHRAVVPSSIQEPSTHLLAPTRDAQSPCLPGRRVLPQRTLERDRHRHHRHVHSVVLSEVCSAAQHVPGRPSRLRRHRHHLLLPVTEVLVRAAQHWTANHRHRDDGKVLLLLSAALSAIKGRNPLGELVGN